MICTRCEGDKPPEDFRTGRRFCKECESKGSTRRRRDKPIHEAIRGARRRAKDKGLEFDLSVAAVVDVIQQQGHRCYHLGTPLHIGCGGARATQLSLDRIDNDRGYTKGNIVVSSLAANRARNDATVDEFRKFMSTVQVPSRAQAMGFVMARLSNPTGLLVSGFRSAVETFRSAVEALGVEPTEIVEACSGMALFACFAHDKERCKIMDLAEKTVLVQVITTQGEVNA